jgi:hypothetical protein
MATSTGALILLRYTFHLPLVLSILTTIHNTRTLGNTVGTSIGQTIYSSVGHSVYLDAIFG